MTTSWHLTICNHLVILESELVIKHARKFRPKLSSTIYFVKRKTKELVFYEPFINGGSISATYAAKKSKRAELIKDICALCLPLFESGGRVLFCRHNEDNSFIQILPKEIKLISFSEIIMLAEKGNFGIWEIDFGHIKFLFSGVEINLFTPINVDSGAKSGGYYATYEVTAKTVVEAIEKLRKLANDEGGWCKSMPLPIVVGIVESPQPSNRIGGRVFFMT